MEVFLSELAVLGQVALEILSPVSLMMVLSGTFLGIIVGAIPGMTATMTLALLIGLTYGLGFYRAIAMMMGLYTGAIYGGCIASIMVNIPGTPSAATTTLDGFPLAKKGEGGQAIGMATIASFFGMLVGIFALVVLTPLIYQVALKIGAWEQFLLAIFGVTICGNLGNADQPLKGWIAGFLGLIVASVGLDPIYAIPRFTFGNIQLMGGISIIAALIGMFGISEILDVLKEKVPYQIPQKVGRIVPPLSMLPKFIPNAIRSGIIGVIIGIIPGVGENTAAWIAYDMAKRSDPHPETFGTGNYHGVVSAETANNACIGGALIPILTLAIPGSVGTALLMAAMIVHGVRPGPMLRFEFPGFTYHVGLLLTIASVCMLILGLLMARPLIHLLKIKREILLPLIIPLCTIGAYASNMRHFDIKVMLFLGFVATILRWMNYPMAPLVLGLILGPMADNQFRRAMLISRGNFFAVFQRPISVGLMICIALMLLSGTGVLDKIRSRRAKGSTGQAG
ncbi:MAG: tripartite tricarboxylate transporter permease [Limnochordia bacterium]|jgi:putative tricarboxylic transport membrane protein